MGTVPGTIVQATNYHNYMWIMTMGEPHMTVVDGAPANPVTGRLYGCTEVGKPVKVPYEAGRFLLDHCAYTGIVRVQEHDREDGTGTDLDIAGAKAESEAKFAAGDEERWQRYLEYIMDRIERKKPIPPMPDSVKAIQQRHGYKLNLADFTSPLGGLAQPAPETSGAVEVAALKAQNADLADKLSKLTELLSTQAQQVNDLTDKLNTALGEPVPEPKPKKGK